MAYQGFRNELDYCCDLLFPDNSQRAAKNKQQWQSGKKRHTWATQDLLPLWQWQHNVSCYNYNYKLTTAHHNYTFVSIIIIAGAFLEIKAGGQWRIQETGKGGSKVSSAKRAKFGVTPTSGAVELGKIPFSARGSPILDCVELLWTVN